MPDPLSMREATLADLPIILHHRMAMFEDMGFQDRAAMLAAREASERYLEQALADGAYRGWLLVTGQGQVVAGGGIVISPWPGVPGELLARRAMILNVYTEPPYRRRGLARDLMRRMIAWARDAGFHSISLHASDAGRPLYQALGFAPTSEMRLKLE